MKISGFSMARNADKLYYPLRQAIESVLPLVDEFVVAIGQGDNDDRTRELVAGIRSNKVRIIDTVWDIEKYPRGMEHAHQTDIAKSHCTGDWLIYLQADEVIHEKYLETIRAACSAYLHDKEVEGFILGYKHFWGDYQHHHKSHGWYPYEIRIIRNDPDIHSWESAQSFRRIPDFDGLHYRQKENTFKLKVVQIDAEVFHYGWVRPPALMTKKTKAFVTNHKGKETADKLFDQIIPFDYGPLHRLNKYEGSHPAVMKEWIKGFHWKDQLQYTGKSKNRGKQKARHERIKNRLVSFIKYKVLHMPMLGEFNNFTLLKKR
ncbi:MAG: glycosyltransferase family 2 protein [Bacteroidales bacterium]